MTMARRFGVPIALMGLFASASFANVALTTGTGYSAAAGAPNFNVPAGTSIDVPITLSEYGATQEVTSNGGLDFAGFLVTHASPGPNDDSIITNAGVALSSFPDVLSSTYDDDSATVTMDVFPKDSLTAAPANVSQGLIQLGTVTIQASSLIGQVSTYTLQNAPGGDIFLTDNFTELDPLLSPSTYTFTVTATSTPEPGSVVFLTGCGLMLCRWRSKRRS